MKKIVMTMVLLMIAIPAYSQMGYSRVPWGASTWSGSGRPPHWGPPKRQHSSSKYRRPRPVHPIAPPLYHHRKPVYFEKSGYRSGRTPSKHSQIRVRSKPLTHLRSTSKCGGQTRTTQNREGQLVIEYVTGARNCSK